MTQLRLERLADVPLSRVVAAWNECFSDYYVPIAMDVPSFAAAKLGNEDLHPELSFLAFADGREAPIGFLLNAVRTVDGERIAWNGGTAVHPDFRGRGVGAALLEKAMETYREQGVAAALLEAFVQNEGAQRLYRRFGYERFDTLHGMEAAGAVDFGLDSAEIPSGSTYRIERRPPSALEGLRFAPETPPWQTMRQSAKTGEALVAEDAAGRPVGYALRRRSPAATTLLQCAVDPALSDEAAAGATRRLLGAVFSGGDAAGSTRRRTVFAAPASQPALRAALASAGFEDKYALVHMRLRF
ncbi:GNAT family N-acetyltransferase [Paenibacillus antri]|uniref:GNAT family N-acetyltransferase n=1 Tax=Paenibacillus antri TaxID=2582848 RepID=A0A5R9G5U6_9BACL|nr:N-acetyltransferase [Paenibacillus antri]TLS49490.1 GNAT family N-acetyltransferase [Paenibacillus antri]